MATPALSNPFDEPFPSESVQQTSQQGAQQSDNPFDEPLPSELAVQQDPGQVTNDVGNTVIVPKGLGTDNEESFSDTMKRAIQQHNSMSAEQQKQAIDKEMATAPKKAGEVMAAIPIAAAAPFAGAEALLGMHTALSAGFKALTPALTRGIVGIGEWAAEHPVARTLLWEALKAAMVGTAAGAGAKLAGKAIKSTPD